MSESWERRIRRADDLASRDGAAAPLLTFYAQLLRGQKAVYDSLGPRALTGSIDHDAPVIADAIGPLMTIVAERGPAPLAAEARAILAGDRRNVHARLVEHWSVRADTDFFSKASLQPYATCLVDRAVSLQVSRVPGDNRCPRCGGAPQLSVLEAGGAEQGSSRQLQCATCLTPWPFARVLCPYCGEQDEHQLSYFRSPAFDHVRVDACQRCRRYLKTIDLGALGLAVPLVDEVAAAPLDAWAHEHGYEKIELNLLGL
jgi:formate dehydrogenase accessory protein FdhE